MFVTICDQRMRIRVGRHYVTGFRTGKRHVAPSELDRIERLRKANGPRNGARFAGSIRIEHPVADIVVIPRAFLSGLQRIENAFTDVRRSDAAGEIVRIAFYGR